jgi:hypothetical protein
VIEAHLRGWTADGLVRQAAFKGMREDKSPQEVVREMPVMTEAGHRTEDRSRDSESDDKDLEDEGAAQRRQVVKPPAARRKARALHSPRPRLLG